ncbi:hypothetical protein TcWFU_008223 [Taenia crassiceps]|uniref:Hyaluronan/mRNA-binding protein domain-containing protein n=1 Tax=Taenia crassiceps TaxID=6207 RepID=A0ABR4QCI7_9CEST
MTSAVHYTYSVQVKSRFDLFTKDAYNREDPDVLLTRLRNQKRERKSSGKEASEKVAQEPIEPIQTDVQVSRNERRTLDQKAPRDASGNVRGRATPRGRGVFTRNRASKPSGQRVFDRHSGSDKTGVKAVMKKDGHGTGNWGTMDDELEAQMAEVVLEPATEEESPPEEEYREQLKSSKTKVQLATKGTRRPNDGKNVFSDMVEVHKSKPPEPKVEIVLEDKPQAEEEVKPVVFEFGRGRPMPRGRGVRPFGFSDFRGRGSGSRFDRQPREELQSQPVEPAEQQQRGSTESNEPSGQPIDRSAQRGGRRGERGYRGSGRGFVPRGGFNGERGRGRGGGPGGDRPSFRGGRPPFRGGERGAGRGMRGPRGGGTGVVGSNVGGGGFRYGRGGFEDSQEGRGGTRAGARVPANTAPSMDSDADFPALK